MNVQIVIQYVKDGATRFLVAKRSPDLDPDLEESLANGRRISESDFY